MTYLNGGSGWNGLVTSPDAADAPAVAIPEAFSMPAAGRGCIRAARIVTAIVAATVIAIRAGRSATDDRAGGKSADHAGGDGATACFSRGRRCNASDCDGCRNGDGGKGSDHGAPLNLISMMK